MKNIFRLRSPHVPVIVRGVPERRVSLAQETIDSLAGVGQMEDFSMPVDLGADDLAGSADLEDWSNQVETDSAPASDDVSAIEEDSKRTGKPAAAPKKSPPSGSSVIALKAVQSALKQLGYDLGPAGVDGIIGKYTRAAIVKYKKDQSISPANATIDANLRKSLDAALKAKTSSPPTASAGGSGGLLIAVIAAAVAIGAYFVFKV